MQCVLKYNGALKYIGVSSEIHHQSPTCTQKYMQKYVAQKGTSCRLAFTWKHLEPSK